MARVKINQERPLDGAWKIWHRATRLWTNKHRKLDKPLGRWIVLTHQMGQKWHAYIDQNQKCCYGRNRETTFKFYQHKVKDGQLRDYTKTTTEYELPPDVTLVQIWFVGSTWRMVKQGETR